MTNIEYRLVALDMDGTLLNSNHEISAYTRNVLERAAEAGVVIVLSTGRCRSELQAFLDAIPGISYVIGENGAWVYDVTRNATIAQINLPDEYVESIFQMSESFDLICQAFVNGQSYIQTCDEGALAPYHIADFAGVFRSGSQIDKDVPGICLSNRGLVEKINLYFCKQSEQEAFIAMATRLPLTLSASIGIGCELSPPGVTKSSGLETLCRHLSIPLASVMAVGDGGNDLDIMGVAGLSVAMGNAIEPVKALAHTMTEDNDHDGAAHAIERYVISVIKHVKMEGSV